MHYPNIRITQSGLHVTADISKDDAKIIINALYPTRQVPQIWTNQSEKSDWGGIEIITGNTNQHYHQNYFTLKMHLSVKLPIKNGHQHTTVIVNLFVTIT